MSGRKPAPKKSAFTHGRRSYSQLCRDLLEGLSETYLTYKTYAYIAEALVETPSIRSDLALSSPPNIQELASAFLCRMVDRFISFMQHHQTTKACVSNHNFFSKKPKRTLSDWFANQSPPISGEHVTYLDSLIVVRNAIVHPDDVSQLEGKPRYDEMMEHAYNAIVWAAERIDNIGKATTQSQIT